MKTFRSLAEVERSPNGRAVAVGTFDGVHLGHRSVITSALRWGRAHQAQVAVVTFDPHPLRVLQRDDPPRLLSSQAVKEDAIGEVGVDELVVIPFTPEFSRLEADDFCREVLAGALGARHVSVGENFRFGHGARGDPALLERCGEFETAIVPLIEVGGAPVSSTRIRELLERGDVAAARELLGRPFQLEGTVVEGSARGRSLGVPTANVLPEGDVIVPAKGVYAGFAHGHAAAINIGVRPTFESQGQLLVEAYLLDYEGDLYGDRLRISFLERLRDEERFESAQALMAQMEEDIARTREVVSAQGAEVRGKT